MKSGLSVAFIGLIVVLSSVATVFANGSDPVARADVLAQESSGVSLELTAQTFSVEPDGTFRLDYRLTGLDDDLLELRPPPEPEVIPTTTIPPTTTVAGIGQAQTDQAGIPPTVPPTPAPPPPPIQITAEVTNYSPITSTSPVDDLVGSDVDPDGFVGVVDGVAIDLRPLATIEDDGTVSFTLDIDTDVADSVEDRLKFDTAGLFPVRVQILIGDPVDNNIIATAGTIVERLPGPTDPQLPPPIDLAVVVATPQPPLIASDEELDAATTQLGEAIDLAAALDAPMALEIPPTLVADAGSTADGAATLATAFEGDELLSMPLVPLDVSSAVAAGRADVYTSLVIEGENVLTEAVPTTPTRRDVWVATAALSAAGAEHLRDLGARYVIFPESLYRSTISEELPATDLFVDAALGDGGRLPILIVDQLSEQLTPTAADETLAASTSTEWAVRNVTEMLLEQRRDDLVAGEPATSVGALPERSRILSTPDLRAPDVRLLDALVALADTTPSIRFNVASALNGVTDVQDDNGEPMTVQLPDVAGPSLVERIELIDSTAFTMASAASMLPPDDPRPAEWSAELAGLLSTGYSDADVVEATDALLAEADRLRDAVVLPEPFTFTLTGRRGTIEVRLGNTIDEDLRVVVHLESSKVSFPSGDQEVTLRGGDENSVIVPVEARSNGTSSIELTVLTPTGEVLDEPVSLTATVTALTGVGQVLTGGFVLVLLTWWFTHWRSRRRARDNAESPVATTEASK